MCECCNLARQLTQVKGLIGQCRRLRTEVLAGGLVSTRKSSVPILYLQFTLWFTLYLRGVHRLGVSLPITHNKPYPPSFPWRTTNVLVVLHRLLLGEQGRSVEDWSPFNPPMFKARTQTKWLAKPGASFAASPGTHELCC